MSELKNSVKETKLCLKYKCLLCGKTIVRPIKIGEKFLQGSATCECGTKIIFACLGVL